MAKLPKLLESPKVRRLVGLALTVQGVIGFLAPKKTIRLNARLWLREAFENPGDLEPTDAYAGLVRDASLAAVVFGVLTLRRAARDEATAVADRLLSREDGDSDGGGGADDDGPVVIDASGEDAGDADADDDADGA